MADWREDWERDEDDFYENRDWNRGDYRQERYAGSGDRERSRNRRDIHQDRDWNAGNQYDRPHPHSYEWYRRQHEQRERYGQGGRQDYQQQGFHQDRNREDIDRWGYSSRDDENRSGQVRNRESYRGNARTFHQGDSSDDRRRDYRSSNQRDDTEAMRHDYDHEDPYSSGSANSGQYGRSYSERRYDSRRRDAQNTRRTAGLQSDMDDQGGYQPNRGFGEDYNTRRDRRPSDFGRGYGDYVGYDQEGAFYQDLDNPYRNRYWGHESDPFDMGDFTGIGPAGYRRSNERIEEDIHMRLTRHGHIDARDIEIEVDDGKVTLRGSVPDRWTKRAAEDEVESVMGVENVDNQLKVRDRTGRNRSRDRDYPRQDRQYYENVARTELQERTLPVTGNLVIDANDREKTSGAVSHTDFREDMEVISKDGKSIGKVKEIRNETVLVDRELARDIYIPFHAFASVGASALLNFNEDEIDQLNWEKPSLV